MRLVGLVFLGLALASPVSADVLTGDQARKQLFSLKGYEIQYSEGLSAINKKIVKGIIPLMAKQLRQPVRYYTAIAYSPDDGLVHDALQAAMNHHSPAAAAKAAITACNGLKSKGTKPCTVAAQVIPKSYKPRALTLSVDATAAFDKRYRKMKGPKAFAISPATGAWGIAASDSAALSACKNASNSGDCVIVIRN